MNILHDSLFDGEGRETAFDLFKWAPHEECETEAYWRVATCYLREIGTEQNRTKAKYYAKKSIENNSIDGIFWYGCAQENEKDAVKFYQIASQHNHLAGNYFLGWENW
jgi:TPR repeat protein